MLFSSVAFIKEQLNRYLDTFPVNDPPNLTRPLAKLENIAGLDENAIKSTNNVLITLVNLNEEASLKNTPHYVKDFNTTTYRNPPVYLNLYILFTACFTNYEHALVMLSRVLRFFQGRHQFNHKNSVTGIKDFEQFQIVMDLYSPTFEQTNYLWSTLGGKQYPFALYKMRLVEVERESAVETRETVREMSVLAGNYSNKTQQ